MSKSNQKSLTEVQDLINYLRVAREENLRDGKWIDDGARLWRKAQAKCSDMRVEDIASQAGVGANLVKATALGAAYEKKMGGVIAAMYSENMPAAAMAVYLGSSAGFQTAENKTGIRVGGKEAFQAAYGSFLGDQAADKVFKCVVVEDLNRYLNYAKTEAAGDLSEDYQTYARQCAMKGTKPLGKLDFLNHRIEESSFSTRVQGISIDTLALLVSEGANRMGELSTYGADSCFVCNETLYLHHATSDTTTSDQKRQALHAVLGAMNTTKQHMVGEDENPLFGCRIEAGFLIGGRLDTNNIEHLRHGDGSGYHVRKALGPCVKNKELTQEDVYGFGQLKLAGLAGHCVNTTELALLFSHNIHITGTPTLDLYGTSRKIRKLLSNPATMGLAQDLAVSTLASIVERSAKCLTFANLEENGLSILGDSLDEITSMVDMVATLWTRQDRRHGATFSDAIGSIERMLAGPLGSSSLPGVEAAITKLDGKLTTLREAMASTAPSRPRADKAWEMVRAYHDDPVYAPTPDQDYLAQAKKEAMLSDPETAYHHKRASSLHDINFEKLIGMARNELEERGAPLDNNLGILLEFLAALNPEDKRERGMARDLARRQPWGVFGVNNPVNPDNPKTLREHAQDFGLGDKTYDSANTLFQKHNLDGGSRERSRFPLTNKLMQCARLLASPSFLDHGRIFEAREPGKEMEMIRELVALATANDCVYSSTKEQRAKPSKKTHRGG